MGWGVKWANNRGLINGKHIINWGTKKCSEMHILFKFYAYTVKGNDGNVHGLISEGAYMYMYNRKVFFVNISSWKVL